MTSFRFLAAAFVVVLPLSACGRAEARPGHVARDSAGVRIVESTAPAWGEGEGWRLAAEPLLEIGEEEAAPAYQLHEVAGAVRLSDGTLVVANAGTGQLRFYGAAGRHLRDVGGKGEGPGEFRSISWLARRPGDTLAVYDVRLRRLSFFSPEGTHARVVSLASAPVSAGASASALLADGSILANPGRTFGQEGTSRVVRDPVELTLLSPDASSARSLGSFPWSEEFVYADGSMSLMVTYDMGKKPVVAAGGDGFWFGGAEGWELRRLDGEGRPRQVVRLAREVAPVTSQDVDRNRARWLENADPGSLPLVERIVAAMPAPERLPAYDELHLDAGGRLWVHDYALPWEPGTAWTVIDADGALLGTVQLPERFRPMDIGEDYVLGVWRDDVDVERLRLYRLEKPAGA